MTIKSKLMLIISILVSVMFIVSTLISYSLQRSHIYQSIEVDMSEKTDNLSKFISDWIKDKGQNLAAASSVMSETSSVISSLSQSQKTDDFLFTYLGTHQGEMVIFPHADLPADFDPRQRPWFQQAQKVGTLTVTPPYKDASTNELVITVAKPIPQGVIASDVTLKEINEEVLNSGFEDIGFAVLVDENNNYLAHPNAERLFKPVSEEFNGYQPNEDFEKVSNTQSNYIAHFTKIEGSNWKVGVFLDRDIAISPIITQRNINIGMTLISVLLITGLISIVITRVLSRLDMLQDAMSGIATGDADLTKRLPSRGEDELAQVAVHFNKFIEFIQQLVSESKQNAEKLKLNAQDASDEASKNLASIERQDQEIHQCASAINEMSSISSEVADNAKSASESASQVADKCSDGAQKAVTCQKQMHVLTKEIGEISTTINELDSQAQKINTILATIQGIAEQTNLLALNAAIEAARAGDQGRGFAVVADEVRALSQNTHEATEEIQQMISTLQNQTKSAVKDMEKSSQLSSEAADSVVEVSEGLNSINQSIALISERAYLIANHSQEQHQATEEISRIASAIQDAAGDLTASANTASDRAEELNTIGKTIESTLSRFNS